MVLRNRPPRRPHLIYIFTNIPNKTALSSTVRGHDEIQTPCIKKSLKVSLCEVRTHFPISFSLHSLSYVKLTHLFWKTGNRAQLNLHHSLTLLFHGLRSCMVTKWTLFLYILITLHSFVFQPWLEKKQINRICYTSIRSYQGMVKASTTGNMI